MAAMLYNVSVSQQRPSMAELYNNLQNSFFCLLQHAAGIKVKFGEETESILVMVHDDLVLGDFFFFFFFNGRR